MTALSHTTCAGRGVTALRPLYAMYSLLETSEGLRAFLSIRALAEGEGSFTPPVRAVALLSHTVSPTSSPSTYRLLSQPQPSRTNHGVFIRPLQVPGAS